MDAQGKVIMESILETKASTLLEFFAGLRGSLFVTFEEGTWGLGLSMIRRGTREGSGARTIEGRDARDTGALICAARFRLRYSRIQAAFRAGSR